MNVTHLSRSRFAALIAVGVGVAVVPASARITRSRSSPYSNLDVLLETPWYQAPLYSLLVGGGFEYQTDSDQTEYGFPLLIEYNFTEQFKLTLEPVFTDIVGKKPDVQSVSGFGDLETTAEYEFLSERRYRPSLSFEGAIRWPTAADPDLGDPGRDYSLGLIASKDFVFMDIDLNVLYTFIGGHDLADTVEISLATTWRINHELDLIVEVADVSRVGMLIDEHRNEMEATVGLSWQINPFLKLEQGIVFKEAGQWEAVFAWEWSIGGD